MSGISFSCPACGAQVPVPDSGDPEACPKCGYVISDSSSSSSSKTLRRCMNCKLELRSGVTLCPRCGTDQETGRRSLGSGKPKKEGTGTADNRLDEKAFPLSSMALLLVVGIGIAVCIFFLTKPPSSSKPLLPPTRDRAIKPPKVHHPGPEKPAAVPQGATGGVAHVTQTPAEDLFRAAMERYETALRQGRLDTAQQARRQIEHRYAGGSASGDFWRRVLSPTQCVSISFYYPCTVCSDGYCPVCHNTPLCASCKGSATCKACGGAPTRQIPCPSCVCQACDGDGRCAQCGASGTVGCQACGAIGYTDRRNIIACGSCSGTGQRKGLRTANGYMPIRCLTCNGSGRITQHIRLRCTACNGLARVKCPTCAGSTQCTACRGTGRTQGCVACGGKGVVDAACKTCGGSKVCPTCSGVGHCQRCLGSGKCYLCGKTGLIREAQMPAATTWLSQTGGYVIFDTAKAAVFRSSDKAGHHEVAWNGRSLSFDVLPGEVVWISTSPSFQQIGKLFVPPQPVTAGR